MNDGLIPFQKVLDALLNESKDISRRYLTEFSDIDPASLKLLQETWPRVGLKRKIFKMHKFRTMHVHAEARIAELEDRWA